MPSWTTTFKTSKTRTASACEISLSASSWLTYHYIFSMPHQVFKKKLCKFLKIHFHSCFSKIATLTPVSISFTALCPRASWQRELQEFIIFPPSVSLRLSSTQVRFLRSMVQKATTSHLAATDNRIKQAEAKVSCLFRKDNINELLCTREFLGRGRNAAKVCLEQPAHTVPNPVWRSARTTEPRVMQVKFTVRSPRRPGVQRFHSEISSERANHNYSHSLHAAQWRTRDWWWTSQLETAATRWFFENSQEKGNLPSWSLEKKKCNKILCSGKHSLLFNFYWIAAKVTV